MEYSQLNSCFLISDGPVINWQGITLLVSLKIATLPSQVTTVRVTATVYRGFFLLKEAFTHRHWVGIRDCTNLFRLAVSGVFVKQSPLPCYCNLQFPLSRKPQALLLPKLRSQFADSDRTNRHRVQKLNI